MQFSVTLKNNYEFRRLYAKGRSAPTSCLVVYTRPNRGKTNRVGYTVSVKIGKAVVRNRIRRKLREIYRLHESELPRGIDLVIVARSKAAQSDYHRLEHCFIKACSRLSLLTPSEDKS